MFVNVRCALRLAGSYCSCVSRTARWNTTDCIPRTRPGPLRSARSATRLANRRWLYRSQRIAGGDLVVTSANFLIDSESQLQAAAGAYTPPRQAPAAIAKRAPRSQFSGRTHDGSVTAHKGANAVRVKLLAGAASRSPARTSPVNSSCRRCPEMGMAAMNERQRKLHDQRQWSPTRAWVPRLRRHLAGHDHCPEERPD